MGIADFLCRVGHGEVIVVALDETLYEIDLVHHHLHVFGVTTVACNRHINREEKTANTPFTKSGNIGVRGVIESR